MKTKKPKAIGNLGKSLTYFELYQILQEDCKEKDAEIKRLNKVCKAYWQSRSEFIEENQKLKELLLKFKINVI